MCGGARCEYVGIGSRHLERPAGIRVDCAVNGIVHLAISDHILKKLDEVLQRPYFAARIESDLRRSYLTKLEQFAARVQPDPSVHGIADDEEDDLVLGTAVAANADYLVTGDHGLLKVEAYGGVAITTAREFLTILETV